MRLVPVILLLASLLAPALLDAPRAAAADCQFVLGFKTIHDMIPAVVGECMEDERHNPQTGDTLQSTTKGLLVWRKADNFTAFTDGHRTWVNGPNGLQERLNTERFAWERDVTPPTVVSTGAGQVGNALGFGFVFQNSNPTLAVMDSLLTVTAYDAAGNVLNSQSGVVRMVLPGQKRAVSNVMVVPDGAKVSRVDMRFSAGKFAPVAAEPTFRVASSAFTPANGFYRATGVVESPYKQAVSTVYVSAVAYDAAGKVIGGGAAYIDRIPAGGQAEVSVPVVASETPARIELYPSITSNSKFE